MPKSRDEIIGIEMTAGPKDGAETPGSKCHVPFNFVLI